MYSVYFKEINLLEKYIFLKKVFFFYQPAELFLPTS